MLYTERFYEKVLGVSDRLPAAPGLIYNIVAGLVTSPIVMLILLYDVMTIKGAPHNEEEDQPFTF